MKYNSNFFYLTPPFPAHTTTPSYFSFHFLSGLFVHSGCHPRYLCPVSVCFSLLSVCHSGCRSRFYCTMFLCFCVDTVCLLLWLSFCRPVYNCLCVFFVYLSLNIFFRKNFLFVMVRSGRPLSCQFLVFTISIRLIDKCLMTRPYGHDLLDISLLTSTYWHAFIDITLLTCLDWYFLIDLSLLTHTSLSTCP